MATTRANLDVTQYVRITSDPLTPSSLLLQSHRDTVRVVFSDMKPAKGNTVYHELGGEHPPLDIPRVDVAVWALAMTTRSALTITQQSLHTDMTSSFGEQLVSSKEPTMQLVATHGLIDKLLTISLGGSSVSTEDSMFKVESGINVGAVGAILSREEITARAGQSIENIFSTIFNAPVTGNSQSGGLITSETSFTFGYDDDQNFGIAHAFDGELEIQDLTITTGAGADESARITVDGVVHNVPITDSSIEQNAYEIAIYLDANDPRYNATSNGPTVTLVAIIPDVGKGTFSFTSNSCAATFTEINVGSIGTITWTPKQQWNVRPNFDIDPTKGNVYKIQYAFTGFDGVEFYIKNYLTNSFELVHIIRYGNSNTTPSAANPIFRVGWATRNTNNSATNVTIKGASTSASNDGMRVFDSDTNGVENEQTISTAGIDINVLTIRNRRVFNGKPNRSDSLALTLDLLTESSKITKFKVISSAIVNGHLDFEYVDEPNSLIEVAKNNAVITGGRLVATYDTLMQKDVNVKDLINHLSVGDMLTITAQVKNGGTGDVSVNYNYRDDL